MDLLHTEIIGQNGFPLILLHGWGQNLTHMKPLAECLSHHSEVHLIDLPGFGHSTLPNGVWDSFQYADRIIAYMDEKQIKQADFLGHSFGGKVAFSLASRYPERVRHLVLLASSGLKRKRTWLQSSRLFAIRNGGKLLKGIDRLIKTDFFKTQFSARYGSTDYQQAGAMRPILVKSVNEDLEDILSTVKAPTLLLWGEQDSETPVEVAKRFQNQIKNSKLILFPGKDHHLHHEVSAHLCASYILPFLHADSIS